MIPCYFLQNHASGLHKQLREAQRQEQALLEKLGASEGARQQQEMRLEASHALCDVRIKGGSRGSGIGGNCSDGASRA